MRSLEVDVARLERRSPVWVGRGLLGSAGKLIRPEAFTKVALVADSGGASKWLAPLCEGLGFDRSDALLLNGGEANKSVQGLTRVWEHFVARKLDRRSLVVTMGGGAASDLVGFAAATYMRGMAFVNIPTTLLAQVDASIGGKNGINFLGVKNLVGAVLQPAGVVIDLDTISTLPAREIRSGFAEIVKHGLIADRDYLEQVTSRPFDGWSEDEMESIVFRSCEIKRDVVQADETETGLRKTLNFGHSIGHAVEGHSLEHSVPLTHGEAVAIGMAAESLISAELGLISRDDYGFIVERIGRAGLPTRMPQRVEEAVLRTYLARDKKSVGGKVKWTLLEAVGRAKFDVEVPDPLIGTAIASIQPFVRADTPTL